MTHFSYTSTVHKASLGHNVRFLFVFARSNRDWVISGNKDNDEALAKWIPNVLVVHARS